MILFLDTVSPIPKFIIIKDYKIIELIPILEHNITKISDNIIQKYLVLDKKYNLNETLIKLVVCSGPGSFTSLRVGISFIYGLSFSKNIPLYGISSTELLGCHIKEKYFYNTLLFVISANNQNFVCFPSTNSNKEKYKIFRINENFFLNNVNLNKFSKCVSNCEVPDYIKHKFNNIKEINIVNIDQCLDKNIINNLKKEKIIKPIYITENDIYK